MSSGLSLRARARPAGDVPAQHRVAVVALEAGLAVGAGGRVGAVVAVARGGVADVGVAVAVARLADGEVPPARLAEVALAPVLEVPALALAGADVAEIVQGAHGVAVASCKDMTPEQTSIEDEFSMGLKQFDAVSILYPTITHYRTVPLILDHVSYLVGN
jgi:hypothetical protein